MGRVRNSNSRVRRSRAKLPAPPDTASNTAGSSSRLTRKRTLDNNTASTDRQSSAGKPSPAKKERLETSRETRVCRRSARLQRHQPTVAESSPLPEHVVEASSATTSEPPISRRRRRTGRHMQPSEEDEDELRDEISVKDEITVKGPAILPLDAETSVVEEDGPRQYRPRLTRKNLRRLNRITSDKNPGTQSCPSEYTVHSSLGTGVRTTTTATSYLAMQALKNGVFDCRNSKIPANLDDIRSRYDQACDAYSDTESVYEDYVEAVSAARNSATLTMETSGLLLKKYPREGYKKAYNQKFTNFPKDAGINRGLSIPVPDFVEGLRKDEFQPFPIDEMASGAVLYRYDPCSLTLPHLAGEWSLYGTKEKVRWRSAYHGAALVYARNKALAYLGMSDPPGHAQIITFTNTGSRLTIYAHYSAVSEKGRTEYHQYPVISTNVLDTRPGFTQGRTALRCAQDYAREVSYTLRDELKDRWEEVLHSVAEGSDLPVSDGTTVENSENDGREQSEEPTTPTSAAPGSSIEVAPIWE